MTRSAQPTPARRGHLALGAGLSLAWQALGPADGESWLVLHGGPGAGAHEGLAAPLAPLLRRAMDNQRISAERYTGAWTDVGTPERLAQLNSHTTP